MRVFVLDKNKRPLMPCRPARARKLLDSGKARVASGKKAGLYQGRVAVRASGNFNITTGKGVVEGINYRFCRKIHCCDGYNYG